MSGILNISQLQNIEALAGQTLSQAILTPTGGVNSYGISGFIFDVIGIQEMNNAADITDHFVEDNTAIQDHVALRPMRFTLKGFQGELNDDLQQALAQLFSSVSGIANVFGYQPAFTIGAQQTYSSVQAALAQTNQIVSEASNLFGVFGVYATMATRQQAAYNVLLAMQQSRQLCSVDTPYGTYQNMIIEELRARQDETTLMVSEFSVTLKQIRIVSTLVSTTIVSSLGRVANLSSAVSNGGTVPGQQLSPSMTEAQMSNFFQVSLPGSKG